MLNFAAVFIGGGLGAVLRYSLGILLKILNVSVFPVATFSVNIIGSFLIGFFGVYFLTKPELSPTVRIFLTVGFCGGLTTFSTFSLESLDFLSSGKFISFFLYVTASLAVCIMMTALGAYVANKI